METGMLGRLFEFDTSAVSIGVRPLYNLRLADDIDLLGGSEGERQHLAERLNKQLTN